MLLVFLLLICEIFFCQCDIASEKNSCPELDDYPYRQFSKRCYNSGNVNTTTPQMLANNHYTYETHTVTTEDGYKLEIFRIGTSTNNTKKKGVVFLSHAFFCSSDWWVNTNQRSLAFNLVKKGYEVWLTNRRGTQYSRNDALTLDQFYNFTLDHVALYDTPALLKYVVNKAGQPVHYIGYTEGNTAIFMYASVHPEEAVTLVKGIYAILPATNFDGREDSLIDQWPTLVQIHKTLGYPCVFYPTQLLKKVAMLLCTYFPSACRSAINLLEGPTVQFSPRDLLNFWSRFPAKASFGQLLHYYQIYKTGEFAKYDYGTQNTEVYGQSTPPRYDLKKVTIPTRLFWSLADNYHTQQSTERTYRELGSTDKKIIQIPPANDRRCGPYEHVDFYMSTTNQYCFYPHLFASMESIA